MFWLRNKSRPKVIWHIPEGRDDLIPRKATPNSMAYDLFTPETVTIPKFDPNLGVGSALINTLVAVTPPEGYAIVFRSRSGLACKQGLTVEAGEIDGDYRGLLKVLLYNHSGVDYTIEAGERIGQARFVKVYDIQDEVVEQYPDPDETSRGAGGFGSTGK